MIGKNPLPFQRNVQIANIRGFFDRTCSLLQQYNITRKYIDSFERPESFIGKRKKTYILPHCDVVRNVYERGIIDEIPNGEDLVVVLKTFKTNGLRKQV